MVSDDSEIVSAEAQEGLDSLFISIEKYFTENEIGEILDRYISFFVCRYLLNTANRFISN